MILWDQKIVTSSIIHTGCIKKNPWDGGPLSNPIKTPKNYVGIGLQPPQTATGWSSHLVSG